MYNACMFQGLSWPSFHNCSSAASARVGATAPDGPYPIPTPLWSESAPTDVCPHAAGASVYVPHAGISLVFLSLDKIHVYLMIIQRYFLTVLLKSLCYGCPLDCLIEPILMSTHNINSILMSTHNINSILMSTHNIGFYEEKIKIMPLSSNYY